MKIERLLLKAFGPFTDLELDLAGPVGCVNLIFGENEAGKSSSLRGLEGLCFGIEGKSQDNHIHRKDQMRVGATLRLADGATRTFIRRKGLKNTVLDEQGSVIPDLEFERFLCGVGKSGFEALFCLSYQRLSEGSKTILEENGELGKLLFEARSDLNLRTVLMKLKERSDDLFKGTARSSATIDKALSDYAEHRRILKRGDLTEYKSIEKRLGEFKKTKDALEEQRTEWRLLDSKLHRQLSTIPLVRTVLRARAELDVLGPIPQLPEAFESEYRTANQKRITARSSLEDALVQKDLLEKRISDIQIDEPLLRRRDDIKQLNLQIKQVGSLLTDQPVEAKKATEALAEAKAALSRVRPGEEPDESNLGIDFATNRISALGREKSRLEQVLNSAKAEVQTISRRLAAAEASLEEVSLVTLPDTLPACLRAAQSLERLESNLPERIRELKRQRQANVVTSRQLGAGESAISDFVQFPIPTRSAIQGYVDEFLRLDGQMEGIEQELKQARATLQAAEAERIALLQIGDVPTEAQLIEKRDQRNAVWKSLKKQISQDQLSPVPPEDLVQFEVQIDESDRIADRLRREADNAARLAAIGSRVELTSQQIQDLLTELEACQKTRAQAERDWEARWQGTGIRPDSPRLMFEWIDQFRKLAEDVLKLDSIDQELQDLEVSIRVARLDLLKALGRGEEQTSLSELIRQATQLHTQSQESAGSLRTLQKQIKEDRASLVAANEHVSTIESELRGWENDWQTEIACLRLPRTPNPDEADRALAAIKEAAESLARARVAEKRSNGMISILQVFNGEAEKIIQAVAPDLGDMSPSAAIQTLARQLDAAIAQESVSKTLAAQLKDQELRLLNAAKEIEVQDKVLSTLCSRAHCAAKEDLEIAIQKSASAVRLRNEIESASRDLVNLAPHLSIDEIIVEVEPLDDRTLRNQIEDIEAEISKINATLTQVNQDIGAEIKNLETLDSGNSQVESQRLAEAALARVRSSIRPYLIYTAAESLLRAQIEEYRRANQGPILTKASEIFSVLTDGSFTELTADVDDKDERLLIAIRKSPKTGLEERLKVEALSSATRIGLYLALRLACVYHHIEQREGLPFVADDVLLDFDDARARRVMEELGRLAEKTQVILFTHHKHLVEIGRDVLGARCLVQNLAKST